MKRCSFWCWGLGSPSAWPPLCFLHPLYYLPLSHHLRVWGPHRTQLESTGVLKESQLQAGTPGSLCLFGQYLREWCGAIATPPQAYFSLSSDLFSPLLLTFYLVLNDQFLSSVPFHNLHVSRTVLPHSFFPCMPSTNIDLTVIVFQYLC